MTPENHSQYPETENQERLEEKKSHRTIKQNQINIKFSNQRSGKAKGRGGCVTNWIRIVSRATLEVRKIKRSAIILSTSLHPYSTLQTVFFLNDVSRLNHL